MSDILTPQGLEPAGAIQDTDTQEIFQAGSGGDRDNKQTTMAAQKIYHQKLTTFTPNNIMESDGSGNPRTTSIATTAMQQAINDTNTNSNTIATWLNQSVRTDASPIFDGATIDGHDVGAELSTLNNRVNQGVKTTDSPTFNNATIGGHNIDSELDTLNSRVNQGVKTTDNPTFSNAQIGGRNINTTLDDIETVLDQDLTTTATPTFADVILTGLGAIKASIITLNSRVNQAVLTTSTPTFNNANIGGHDIDAELDTLNSRVDQGVNIADTPTFEDVNISGLSGTVENRIEGNTSDIGTLETKTPQSYKTSDAVTFATVNTGQGANELYPMSQGVRTTDAVEFQGGVKTDGTFLRNKADSTTANGSGQLGWNHGLSSKIILRANFTASNGTQLPINWISIGATAITATGAIAGAPYTVIIDYIA
jgi:hypothetical protein